MALLEDAPGSDANADDPTLPLRAFQEQSISDLPGDSRVGPAGEDPGAGGLRGLEQALAQNLLERGLELEVGAAAVHRDQEFRQAEIPLATEQLDDWLRLGVVGEPNVLRNTIMLD